MAAFTVTADPALKRRRGSDPGDGVRVERDFPGPAWCDRARYKIKQRRTGRVPITTREGTVRYLLPLEACTLGVPWSGRLVPVPSILRQHKDARWTGGAVEGLSFRRAEDAITVSLDTTDWVAYHDRGQYIVVSRENAMHVFGDRLLCGSKLPYTLIAPDHTFAKMNDLAWNIMDPEEYQRSAACNNVCVIPIIGPSTTRYQRLPSGGLDETKDMTVIGVVGMPLRALKRGDFCYTSYGAGHKASCAKTDETAPGTALHQYRPASIPAAIEPCMSDAQPPKGPDLPPQSHAPPGTGGTVNSPPGASRTKTK